MALILSQRASRVAAFALLIAAGCSLVIRTSDLVPREDTVDADASADASDSAVRADTSSADTSVEDAPTWCDLQPGHSLCADFDRPQALYTWSSHPLVAEGGTLAQDGMESSSPPFSLLAAIPSGSSTHSRLEEYFAVVPTDVHIAFDLWLDQASGSSAWVAEWAAADRYHFSVTLLGVNPTVLNVEEAVVQADGGVAYATVLAANSRIPAQAWTHVDVDLSFGGATSVKMSVDDAGTSLGSAPYPPQLDSGFFVRTGVAHLASPPYEAWQVRIDNFTVDVR